MKLEVQIQANEQATERQWRQLRRRYWKVCREVEEGNQMSNKKFSRIDDEIERYIAMRIEDGAAEIVVLEELEQKALTIMADHMKKGRE